MCDNFVVFNQTAGHSFFAKNSDREPGELQVIEYSADPALEFKEKPYIEAHQTYLQNSFPVLCKVFPKFHNQFKALISRPAWIWGAEMGVNEYGLAIGNEAVFSKEKAPSKGLLGMDILRLALHNNKTAKEALHFIINLMKEYPQGGDGGYRHSMKYSNSYLLKDATEAYLLETSLHHWAVKKIETNASISNSYTITGNFDATDPGSGDIMNFKEKYEDKLITYFAKGNQRQKYSADVLSSTPMDLSSLKNLLRSHMNKTGKVKYGMNSLCIHAGFIKSETTASLIVDYSGPQFVVWFTGSPHPCVSLFKPFIFSASTGKLPFYTNDGAVQYSRKQQQLAKKLAGDHEFFIRRLQPVRDEYEREFRRRIYRHNEAVDNKTIEERVKSCFDLEQDYWRQVDVIFKEQRGMDVLHGEEAVLSEVYE